MSHIPEKILDAGPPPPPHGDTKEEEDSNKSNQADDAKERALQIAKMLSQQLSGDNVSTGGGGVKRARTSDWSEMTKHKKMCIDESKYPGINISGVLIGPRGAQLKRMEQESGAKIVLRGGGTSNKGEDGYGEPLEAVISANTDNELKKATDLIYEILNNPEKRDTLKADQLKDMGSTSSSSSSSSVNQELPSGMVEKLINIPNESVGLIIGRRGETISNLQSQSGADIQIAPDSGAVNGKRPVTIRGGEREVKYAEDEIWAIVKGEKMASGGQNTNRAEREIRIAIPNHMVGYLIGRSGDTIRNLQSMTNACIQIQKDNEVAPGVQVREVTISGSYSQVESAEREIKLVLEREAQGGKGASQSSSYPTSNGQERNTDRDNADEIFIIPNIAVAIVIGKRGETIQRIAARTGARIQVQKERFCFGNEREVYVTGPRENCAYAKSEVMAQVNQFMQRQGHQSSTSSYGGYPQQQQQYGYGQQQQYQQQYQQQQYTTPYVQQQTTPAVAANTSTSASSSAQASQEEWNKYYQSYFAHYGQYPPEYYQAIAAQQQAASTTTPKQ